MADGEESFEERSEQATQQRREDFRKAGQVAQSRELAGILIIMGVSLVFYFMSRQFLEEVFSLFSTAFTDHIAAARHDGDLVPALKFALGKAMYLLLPVFGITVLMGVGATVGQIGFLTAWDHLQPDLQRINPMAGFSKLFSMRSLVEGIKSLVKIIIVGTVAFLIIKKELVFTPQVVQLSIGQIFGYMGQVAFRLVAGISALMALMAALDYGYQRWDLEKRMRMTKQEVKEEFKQREGDPLIKSRIKRIQRELAQKRMMDSVPKADVIITNPTHIAVALQYDRVNMAAPVMVAKGADLIAEKIKEIARKHNVPVVENKPLARNLFKNLKIGHPVPRSLYNAVAEVLAYVYKLKGKIGQMNQQASQQTTQQDNNNPMGGV